MGSIDRSGNWAFDSSRYEENERLSAYDAYIKHGVGSYFDEPLILPLSSDNPNHNKIERFLGENFWLTRVETSGHVLATRPVEAARSDMATTLLLVETGTMELTTTTGNINLGPGDSYLRSNSGTSVRATIGAGRIKRLFYPKSQFGDLQTNNGEAVVFRADDPVSGILANTFSGLEHELRQDNKAGKSLLTRIARDLVYNIATEPQALH